MRSVLWLALAFVLTGVATAAPPSLPMTVPLPDESGDRLALAKQPAPVADAAPPATLKADDKGGSTFTLPDGTKVKLVNRDQMRVKAGTRTLTVPRHLKGAIATLPIPPPSYDWTKGGTIAFPILGNDQYGDCFYVYMAHHVQLWQGVLGTPVEFDRAKLVARYKKLSGGDNGLSDYDVFGQSHNGEFYGGVVGPNGPHKILDHMVVNPADTQAVALAQWAFGGTGLTVSLCNEWLNNSRPGAVWDKGRANPNAGHAILLSGKKANGRYTLETWGFNPPIELTQAGLESADPEVLACFSLEWFDPQTGKASNGLHYSELSALWQTLGGRALPPNPFPGPAPVPPVPVPPVPPVPVPPVPVPPGPAPGVGFTGSLNFINGVLVSVAVGGAPAPGVTVDDGLKKAGVNPALILKLLTDLSARPIDRKSIRDDLFAIILDFALNDPLPKVGAAEVAPPPHERFARREEPDHILAP